MARAPAALDLWADRLGELKVEDKALLGTPVGSAPQPLKRLRASHHAVARLLSTGMKAAEVSAITGMCQSRISILQADPTFVELVAFYSEREDARFVDVQSRLRQLGITASEVLQERLEELAEEIPTADLVKVLQTALDRAGHSPVHRVEKKVEHLTREDLLQIKDITGKGRVFDANAEGAEGAAAAPRAPPRHRQAAGAESHAGAEGAEGEPWEGLDLPASLWEVSPEDGG